MDLYSAYCQYNSTTKRSDVDHTELPANTPHLPTTLPAKHELIILHPSPLYAHRPNSFNDPVVANHFGELLNYTHVSAVQRMHV